VGVVYKGWHVERNLHSSCGMWDNKKISQIKHDWTQRTSQAKRWNDFFPKKVRKVGQLLSTSIVQPMFKNMIQSIAFKFIRPGCGKFTITREWSGQIHETNVGFTMR
jgi:hypothetical protein